MKPFLTEDFLLQTRTARTLYHDFAENMPIFDYHCHLAAAETDDFSTRRILERMNVKVVCTTDDPTDTLEHHLGLKTDRAFPVKILPAFRPDKALGVESPREFNKWVGRLKVIARYGVGFDRVDVAAATQHRIVVTNTPGANSAAVAELTIGLMLALARRICQSNQAVRSGQWPRYSGVGLGGKTVGLVGFGSIGREVARRLAVFQCRILVADPYVSPDLVSGCGASLVSFDELLPAADIVCLHAASTPETAGMVNDSFLRKMRSGAFLVNTARGELIDEAALRQSLESGRLRGAALDCFQKEPPGADHPLLQLPQVIVTPHTGARTDEAVTAMGRMALDACLAVLRGERPAHVVNPDVYTGMNDL